ncbi:hypothetical protein BJ085DRAFT_33263 [Dimargaris cristalligena]|uniref:Secreted protein n=1 Tax=Dimargaris cristalligena TaxID=215637 RepID=A0A4P9ZYR4_9FUNG|nr:hypothetical protein BJ085DRAFT_33263 [Dimargaris cristalligena]|eukprot:RKP38886.1 hypothetical protein BJ085DRAFT_33263 [Dimargaris cristalligena]
MQFFVVLSTLFCLLVIGSVAGLPVENSWINDSSPEGDLKSQYSNALINILTGLQIFNNAPSNVGVMSPVDEDVGKSADSSVTVAEAPTSRRWFWQPTMTSGSIQPAATTTAGQAPEGSWSTVPKANAPNWGDSYPPSTPSSVKSGTVPTSAVPEGNRGIVTPAITNDCGELYPTVAADLVRPINIPNPHYTIADSSNADANLPYCDEV